MSKNSLSEYVFSNPYIMAQVVNKLDIRSLFVCRSLSKDFFDASVVEYEKRKDIIHVHLLRGRHQFSNCGKDAKILYEIFVQYSRSGLIVRPKHVFVMIGGLRRPIDYREGKTSLEYLCRNLPKDCKITYLDIGRPVLTTSIPLKSWTNLIHPYAIQFPGYGLRTRFPSMSCLLIPDIEGIEFKSYEKIEDVTIDDVKCVLWFESEIPKEKSGKQILRERLRTESIRGLISRFNSNVSFGGGCVRAAKLMQKSEPNEDKLSSQLVLTFGGHRVRSSSAVLSTTDSNTFLPQLLRFRNSLDFDCNDRQNSTTIAFVIGNHNNFSVRFPADFQTVFPFVAIFGFRSRDTMYGKFSTHRKCQNIDPQRSCVIVLVSFELRKYPNICL